MKKRHTKKTMWDLGSENICRADRWYAWVCISVDDGGVDDDDDDNDEEDDDDDDDNDDDDDDDLGVFLNKQFWECRCIWKFSLIMWSNAQVVFKFRTKRRAAGNLINCLTKG